MVPVGAELHRYILDPDSEIPANINAYNLAEFWQPPCARFQLVALLKLCKRKFVHINRACRGYANLQVPSDYGYDSSMDSVLQVVPGLTRALTMCL